jgi:hypothetical protein
LENQPWPRWDADALSLGVVETVGRILRLELLAHPMCNKHARIDAIFGEAQKLFDWQVRKR